MNKQNSQIFIENKKIPDSIAFSMIASFTDTNLSSNYH